MPGSQAGGEENPTGTWHRVSVCVYTLLLSCVPDWCVHSKLRCHSFPRIAPHCGIWICGLWLRELHLSRTRVLVGSCLPACCKLIQKRARYLCFLCPGTHAAHGPAQSQLVLVVVSSPTSLPGMAALICLRAEPTRIWLEATTELQLELFVAQTWIIKDYFSRFLFLLYQWSFVCESRVEIVGRPCFLTPIPAALIRTAAWNALHRCRSHPRQVIMFWFLSLLVKQNRERDCIRL